MLEPVTHLERGRQETITRIARQLSAMASRRVSLAVGLWGEPGIGKTHAAREVLSLVPCRHLSLHATTEVKRIAASLPRARALPAWAEAQLERLTRGEPLEPEMIAQTLAATLAASAPFVLHLEDVHEADAERISLIESLARAVARTRGVGLLATSRAELPGPFLNNRFEPLSEAETARLLEGELKGDVPEDGLGWVLARTRGNPLFTLEFARYLRRHGFLWSDGERWRWREPPDGFVPVTVEALIADLVADASDDALRAVLESRAMFSSEPSLTDSIWARVAEVDTETLGRVRNLLEARGILVGNAFAHPLFREVIERAIPAERKKIHARRALEALEDDPEAAVAFAAEADLEPQRRQVLYQRAADSAEADGRTVQAGRWLAQAAEEAARPERDRLAHQAALRLRQVDKTAFVRLMSMVIAEEPGNTEAIILLANDYAQTGQTTEMNKVLERLPDDVTAQAAWITSLIQLRFNQRDFVGTLQLWNEHPELHADADASLLYRIGFTKMELNDTAGAEALIVTALKQPNLTPSQRSSLLVTRGLARRLVGKLEIARRDMDEAVAHARASGEPVTLASSLHNRQVVLEMLGLLPEMVADLREAMELYRNAGFTFKYASSLTQLGATLADMGHYEEAELRLLEAHGLLSQFESSNFLLAVETSLCRLYLAWRPPHALRLAQKYAQPALERSKALQPNHLAIALVTASRVATESGEPARGLQMAEDALAIPNLITNVRADAALNKAHALAVLGRKDEATRVLEGARQSAYGLRFQIIELELARLNGDTARVQHLLEWFREHHFVAVIDLLTPEFAQHPSAADQVEVAQLERGVVILSVLGPVSLERDGQPVPTRAQKRLELLCYLLERRITGRAEANTLELVDALYPEMPEPDARKALKQLVYLIRSNLGADSLTSTPTGYALGVVSSDAEDFLRSGDAALWRGPYLGGLTEGWHLGVRDALTLALRERAEALLETDPTEAARLGGVLVQMEPFEADALRLSVQGLERSGKATAARTAYLEGRARLREVGLNLPEAVEDFLTGQRVA